MKNLLKQWNEYMVKGNQLTKELENIEALIEKSKGEDICFTSGPNGATYITVLSPEKMKELRESVVHAIMQIRDEKAAELEKLMGIRKPATINPEFEAAVQEMEQSSKKKPDPVEEKLSEILQAEAERIEGKSEPPEDKSLSKYPPNKRKPKLSEDLLEDIRRMYVDEGKTAREIAEVYKVKPNDVSNFIAKHKLNRRSYDKSISTPKPDKQPEEKECP